MTAVAALGNGPAAAIRALSWSNRPRMPPAATGVRRLGPDGMATGSRRTRSRSVVGGSSRSPIGRRVVESGTPGRALTSVASSTRASGPAAGDDDVVRAGRIGQLVDDRAEDRVGRHGARQARTGCARTIRPPRAGRPRARRRPGGGGSRRTRRRTEGDDAQSIGRARSSDEPDHGDQAEDEERDGEDPPRSSDPTVRGCPWVGSDGLGGSLTSGIEDGGPDPFRPSRSGRTRGGRGQYLRTIRWR